MGSHRCASSMGESRGGAAVMHTSAREEVWGRQPSGLGLWLRPDSGGWHIVALDGYERREPWQRLGWGVAAHRHRLVTERRCECSTWLAATRERRDGGCCKASRGGVVGPARRSSAVWDSGWQGSELVTSDARAVGQRGDGFRHGRIIPARAVTGECHPARPLRARCAATESLLGGPHSWAIFEF
jgi:hypothetical protein